jgi:hypothetical protein
VVLSKFGVRQLPWIARLGACVALFGSAGEGLSISSRSHRYSPEVIGRSASTAAFGAASLRVTLVEKFLQHRRRDNGRVPRPGVPWGPWRRVVSGCAPSRSSRGKKRDNSLFDCSGVGDRCGHEAQPSAMEVSGR